MAGCEHIIDGECEGELERHSNFDGSSIGCKRVVCDAHYKDHLVIQAFIDNFKAMNVPNAVSEQLFEKSRQERYEVLKSMCPNAEAKVREKEREIENLAVQTDKVAKIFEDYEDVISECPDLKNAVKEAKQHLGIGAKNEQP